MNQVKNQPEYTVNFFIRPCQQLHELQVAPLLYHQNSGTGLTQIIHSLRQDRFYRNGHAVSGLLQLGKCLYHDESARL